MKIRLSSLLKITGHHSQVVVYGLSSCLYRRVHDTLEQSGHDSYMFSGGTGHLDKELTASDMAGCVDMSRTSRMCKATITNLAFINYQLYKLGKPLIPLIFCVQIDDGIFRKKGVKPEQVALSKGAKSSITDSELRRCYKIFSELGPDFEAVARESFKFVKLRRVSSSPTEYEAELVQPLWEQNGWDAYWMKRQEMKMSFPIKHKKSVWREMLATKVMLFHCGRMELDVAKITAPVKLKSRL